MLDMVSYLLMLSKHRLLVMLSTNRLLLSSCGRQYSKFSYICTSRAIAFTHGSKLLNNHFFKLAVCQTSNTGNRDYPEILWVVFLGLQCFL